jgi:hypothetical protein
MVGSPEVQSARTEEGLIRRIDHANAAVCAAQLEFLRLVAQVDSLELWRGDGCADMAQWLLVRYGVSDWKARRWIAAAHAIDRPRVSAAMSRGDLGIDKVVELTRFATPETERDLVEWARDVSAGRIRHRGDLARREADHEVRDGTEAPRLVVVRRGPAVRVAGGSPRGPGGGRLAGHREAGRLAARDAG